jgi:predicted RNase H-related nuclease YkuK (DUF458 family)
MKKFKKFGGEEINDVVQYILDYVKRDPGQAPVYDEQGNLVKKGVSSNIKISVGCDSKNKKRHALYAITIMFYDNFRHNGAHVIFKRIRIPRNLISKGKKYSQWEDQVQVSDCDIILKNKDIKSQVYNRLYFEADYSLELGLWLDEQLQGKYYIEHDKNADGSKPFKLIELHLDFNPEEGYNNLSNMLCDSWMGAFSGQGFRVKVKPDGFAATNAADLLVR